MGDRRIDLERIRAAARTIEGRVVRTPLLAVGDTGVRVKAESLQPSGSFKLRGALNSLLSLDESTRRRGVVAHSSGNHAIAVAMAGAALDVPTSVVMPEDAPATKVRRTRAAGASVELVAPDSEARRRRADELAERDGLTLIEPYDSDQVLAATGTIALEVLEQLEGAGEPVTFYVPVSGGGLIGGMAVAAKLADPRTTVIGVEPEFAADALASRHAGRRVSLPAEQMARTLADGLRVQQVGERPWPYLVDYVDHVVTVTEDELLDAMRTLALDAALVAEPSGAVAVAAALEDRGTTGVATAAVAVLSGGNVDPALLARVLDGATAADLARSGEEYGADRGR